MSSIDIYLTPTISVRQAFLEHDVSTWHLNRYIRLIEFCQTIDVSDELTEEHHILPKAVFPEYENLSDHPWNSIELPLRFHFVAHWILSNVFLTGSPKSDMGLAFWCMAWIDKERISSHVFEMARTKMVGKPAWDQRNKNNNAKYNWKCIPNF